MSAGTVEKSAKVRHPRPEGPAPGQQPEKKRRGRFLPYGLMVPGLVTVALVTVIPIAYAVFLSVHETQFLEIQEFAGLENFTQVFLTTDGRWDLSRSLIYVIGSLTLTLPFAFGVALLLNREIRWRPLIRVIIFLPWPVSQTVAALLFRWMINPEYGPLPLPVDVLSGEYTAMAALIVANLWLSYPLATILILSALQTVHSDVIEASLVDGATPPQRLWKIIIPLIRPTLMVASIMLTLLYFNMVTLILVMTGGGPTAATRTLSLTAFRESFHFFNIGVGAAYSITLFVFNLIFVAVYVRLLRGNPYAAE